MFNKQRKRACKIKYGNIVISVSPVYVFAVVPKYYVCIPRCAPKTGECTTDTGALLSSSRRGVHRSRFGEQCSAAADAAVAVVLLQVDVVLSPQQLHVARMLPVLSSFYLRKKK